jgi:hypothetical protein
MAVNHSRRQYRMAVPPTATLAVHAEHDAVARPQPGAKVALLAGVPVHVVRVADRHLTHAGAEALRRRARAEYHPYHSYP